VLGCLAVLPFVKKCPLSAILICFTPAKVSHFDATSEEITTSNTNNEKPPDISVPIAITLPNFNFVG